MPTLETPDGRPVDVTPVDPDEVNRKFQAAMNDDGPDEQAPPRRQPKPAAEEAPKPRRSRQPKEDKSRTAAEAPPEVTPELTAKRAAGIAETFQIAGGALELIGKSAKSVAFRADGLFLTAAAPKIGECVAEVAKYDPAVARMVDKSGGGGKVTAYMALFAVTASIGAQLAVNHGMLKPGLMGSVPAADIIGAFEKPEQPADAEAAPDVPAAA